MARRFLEEFDAGAHSKYLLYYHLVIVTKYRQKILDFFSLRSVIAIFKNLGKRYGVTVETSQGEVDHIHFLITAKPTSDLPKYIGACKSFSSRILKEEGIRTKSEKGAIWSPSYCLLTTGGAPIDVIRRYIERQGKK